MLSEKYTVNQWFNFVLGIVMVICIIVMSSDAYSSHIGFGMQYSFSMLDYTIKPESELEVPNSIFSDVGIVQNNKTYSHDYGFSVFYDDADDFDYVYNSQLRFEYLRFYIPFDKTNNALKGERFGVIYLISYDILNREYNQIFFGINTGFYYSKGKDEKYGYNYRTLEAPLGVIIGDKYKISDYVTLIGTFTFNFYTNLTFNNYMAGLFNYIGDSKDSFETGRKEMIFNINCAYEL
ncbi:MAG: hypothetical protein WBK20_15615 [Spirochaetota bacterium]